MGHLRPLFTNCCTRGADVSYLLSARCVRLNKHETLGIPLSSLNCRSSERWLLNAKCAIFQLYQLHFDGMMMKSVLTSLPSTQLFLILRLKTD